MSPRVNVLLAVFFLIVLAESSHRLAQMQATLYREDIRIGAMPAFLLLPVAAPADRLGPPDPPSPPPPLVIVQHGFSANRHAMNRIAYGLARNGFAVLAADFRGHGQNPTPFNRGELDDDIAQLIAYGRTRPEVDATRIALVGHSMGARAVYQYAMEDENVAAVIPISGSVVAGDPKWPRNVLLLFASGDPERIKQEDRATIARLTGLPADLARSAAGDMAAGTARRLTEIPGYDHVTILFADEVVRDCVSWLRGTWALPDAAFAPPPPGDLREGLIATLAGLLLFFPLAGFLAAGILQVRVPPGAAARGAVWMAAVAPLVGGVVLFAGVPLSFFPYTVGNSVLSLLAVAGAVLAVWVGTSRSRAATQWPDRLREALLGIAAFGLVYATGGLAVSRLFFDLTLSSQRFGWFVAAAVALLPLGIGIESALRPPGSGLNVLRSLAAKAFLIVGLILGVNVFGTLPHVVALMIPAFVLFLPIVEALAARLYTVSGSVVASGVLTALLLAWLPAAIFPIGY
jgi:dienelactone hydrolase